MQNRHLIDLDSYSLDEIHEILQMAKMIMKKPAYFTDSCHGKVLATLFYEPSTRTQMSFQTAMLRLGGSVIGFDNPGNSSVSKGETLKDTIRVVSNYADIIAIRHPREGAAKAASMFSRSPVINAGDGGHLHPTQTLTDLFTLMETKGTLSHLTIGFCGDLKYGRTVHSLVQAMCNFNATFHFVSPVELQMPPAVKMHIKNMGLKYHEYTDLEDVIPFSDIIYMTRIQRERFSDPLEYERVKDCYILETATLQGCKPTMKVLHPLPRVNEIAMDVDVTPHAYYFQQARNGVYVRQALMAAILGAK